MWKVICKFYVLYNIIEIYLCSKSGTRAGMLKKLLLLPVLLNLSQKQNKTAKKATKTST
jgi:hypothetical protein